MIFYKKEPNFRAEKPIDFPDLLTRWTKVKDIEASDLGEVFKMMQAEYWSPEGEAYQLITQLGLHHTSMSVGDVAFNVDELEIFTCDDLGWKEGWKENVKH